MQQALAQHCAPTHTQPLLQQQPPADRQGTDGPAGSRHHNREEHERLHDCRPSASQLEESQVLLEAADEWAVVGCWRATALIFYNLYGIVSKEARASA